MMPDVDRALAIVSGARAAGRTALHEHEGYAVLSCFGLRSPAHLFVPAGVPVTASALSSIPGERLVIKAVADGVLHKTELGAVLVGERTLEWAQRASDEVRRRVPHDAAAGVLLVEFVPHDPVTGGELLASARDTVEFGAVVTLALGGIHAEWLSSALRDDAAIAVTTPGLAAGALLQSPVLRWLTEPSRGRAARWPRPAADAWMSRMLGLASALPRLGILDCEMNPVVFDPTGPIALDALVTLGSQAPARPPRPAARLERLLGPRRIAVAGVSEGMNPGRIILRNILRERASPETITVIKPGCDEIEGCRAVPALSSLPAPVDLLVVALNAAQATPLVVDAIQGAHAESIVLIPGGFEEKEGRGALAARIRTALDEARATPSGGPLIVGGNCLGIRSTPGAYDTLFIPAHKMPQATGPPGRLAIVSQSGAFAIARASRWSGLHPRYIVTLGNQLDVTIGDVLEGLASDPEIDVFAVYVEGFRPGDGARAIEAVQTITARGGRVVLYRAGRTPAGTKASASHTAAIAGDYRLTRALLTQAGATVAASLEAFDDGVQLAMRLAGRPARGRRLVALSNAGFECVAAADWLGPLELAPLSDATVAAVRDVLERCRVGEVVDVHNPLDVTPMTDDEGYEALARALLSDRNADVGVIGCVPLTAALQTVPRGPGHAENVADPGGIVARLGRLWNEGGIPWVAVVDSGRRFDPMADALVAAGVPVLRSMDRALRALGAWTDRRQLPAGL